MPTVLPERIDGTDGLLLRRWVSDDAEARIAQWEREWQEGGDSILGVFVDGRVAGGCGLHRRIGAGGLEIGYWIHPAFLRRGLATRAARMLTDAAFALPEISRVEIHHDKANQASAGVPRKLGFEWLGEVPDAPEALGDLGIEWRWRMERRAWRAER